MKLFANDAPLRVAEFNRTSMKKHAAALFTVAIAALVGTAFPAVAEDGVALAIIYDTSGSMRESVKDSTGKPAPKYVIANRALTAIARQIQAFATNSTNGPRKLDAGVFIFDHQSAREAVKFGPLDAAAIESWANDFSSPSGNTPLGNALVTASKSALDSPLNRKHILVITDGINTAGPTPDKVLPKLQTRATDQGASLGVHFVAFDVDAKVFDGVKKQGATVVAAADEKQLDTQLQFILQKKILLEDEEPPQKAQKP
jgi:hypothetical protein